MDNLSPLSKVFPTLGVHNRTCLELNRRHSAPDIDKRWRKARSTMKECEVEVPCILEPFVISNKKEKKVWVMVSLVCSELNFEKPEDFEFDPASPEADSYKIYAGAKKRALFSVHYRKAEFGSKYEKKVLFVRLHVKLDSRHFGLCCDKGRFSDEDLKKLTARTPEFAFEFVGAYRRMIRLIEWFSAADDFTKEPPKGAFDEFIPSCNLPAGICVVSQLKEERTLYMDRLRGTHPVESDIRRLLCSYKSIKQSLEGCLDKFMQKFTQENRPQISEISHWLELERINHPVVGFLRDEWEIQKRVSFEDVVRPKLWEYFLSLKAPKTQE